MGNRPFISPAPPGTIAIVCNSPENANVYKKALEEIPQNFTETTERETELNLFNEDAFRSAIECGFNVLIYPGSDLPSNNQWLRSAQRALELCSKLGVKLIINSPILSYEKEYEDRPAFAKGWPASFVSQLMNHPALGGWLIKDEPLYYNWNEPFYYFTGIVGNTKKIFLHNEANSAGVELTKIECHDIVSNNFNVISAVDKQHMIFMNLAASYGKEWIGPNSSYKAYLDQYETVFRPPLWMFDLYPIRSKIVDGRIDYSVDTYTLESFLDTFYKKAKESNRPFWAHCLCLAHDTKGASYPLPTVGMMRFEVFWALALGAQGIVFWRYKQEYSIIDKPIENSQGSNDPNNPSTERTPILNKEVGPLNVYGEKTPIWYYVQQVITEIKNHNHIFYKCEVLKHCLCHGSTGNLNGYGALINVTTYGQGVLISHIKTPDFNFVDETGPAYDKYIIIVSCDPLQEQKVDLTFKPEPQGHGGATVYKNLFPMVTNWEDVEFDIVENPESGTSSTSVKITLEEGGYTVLKDLT